MLPKVELHLHLDGAIRYETLMELARQKSLPFPIYDMKGIRECVMTTEPAHLGHVLQSFDIFIPAFSGDPVAIERIAYELCETQAANGVLYFEARYSPHFLSNTSPNFTWKKCPPYRGHGDLTPENALLCALRGFEKGQKDFGVKCRSVLCCISGHPDWSQEIISFCIKYRKQGVVGIDAAGSAHGHKEDYEKETLEVFQEAKKQDIRRTVHAGEAGAADSVKGAIEFLHAERIGHGYRVVQDEAIYEMVRRGGYHLEVCPLSSMITGAVDGDWTKHPARKFAADKVNFSINTDDPTCFGNSMESEFALCREKLGFTDDILLACQINAAKSAFISQKEKDDLIREIEARWPKN